MDAVPNERRKQVKDEQSRGSRTQEQVAISTTDQETFNPTEKKTGGILRKAEGDD